MKFFEYFESREAKEYRESKERFLRKREFESRNFEPAFPCCDQFFSTMETLMDHMKDSCVNSALSYGWLGDVDISLFHVGYSKHYIERTFGTGYYSTTGILRREKHDKKQTPAMLAPLHIEVQGKQCECDCFFTHIKEYYDHLNNSCPVHCIKWGWMSDIHDSYFDMDNEEETPLQANGDSDDELPEVPTHAVDPNFAVPPSPINSVLHAKKVDTRAFAEGSAFKKAAPIRDGKKIKLKKDESFKEKSTKVARFLKISEPTITEQFSETPISANRLEHCVKVLPERCCEVLDDRLSVLDRVVRADKQQMAVHVGPVFVNLRNMASSQSTIYQAGVLVDDRHRNSENAVLGSFVSQVNNQDQHITFFPGAKLPVDPYINQALKFKLAIGDLDMDCSFQTLQTDAIVQHWSRHENSNPTVATINGELFDHVKAIQYKNDNCFVAHPKKKEVKYKDLRVDLGRSLSLRQTDTGDFQLEPGKKRFVDIKAVNECSSNVESTSSKGKGKLNQDHPERMFANADTLEVPDSINEPLVDRSCPNNNLILTSVVDIPLETVHGALLKSISLEDLLTLSDAKAAQRLRICNSTSVGFRVVVEAHQGPMIGAGVVVAYVENPLPLSENYSQWYNVPNLILNPFVDTEGEYYFRPANHMPSWSPLQYSNLDACLLVGFIGPFSNPPKTQVSIALSIYIVEGRMIQPYSVKDLTYKGELPGFHVASMELEQGKANVKATMPLFPGNARTEVGQIVWSQTNAFLSHFHSVKGKMVVSAFVCSSSLISGSVHLSAVHCADPKVLTVQHLISLPSHHVVLTPGANTLIIDLSQNGIATPCVGQNFKLDQKSGYGLCLILWSATGVSSHIEGNFRVVVNVDSVIVENTIGLRSPMLLTAAVANDDVHDYWHNVCGVDFEIPLTDAYKEEWNPLDLVYIKARNANNQPTIRAYHQSLALMAASAWASATISIKVMWFKRRNIEIAKSKHIVCMSVYPNGERFAASHHLSSSEPSGQFCATYDVVGPFNGLRFMGKTDTMAQDEKGKIIFTIDEPSTIRSYTVLVRVTSLRFAGPSGGVNNKNKEYKHHAVFTI